MIELPVYSFPVTFLLLSAVMLMRYFIMAGMFRLICKKTGKAPIDEGPISPRQMGRDIFWSIQSSLIFALAGTFLIKLWQDGQTKIYYDIGEYGAWYLAISLIVYLFIHDTYFYWTHRLLHLYQFKRCHFVHHESRIPTAWTSFSFHPSEAVIQALILPVLVVLIPIHWMVLVTFLIIMSVCGLLNHLGFDFYPSILEKKFSLISATHHQRHHKQVTVNYGLYFTIWDKLMKTEAGDSHG